MNSAIIISFTIGGLFLISVLAFNNQVANQSQELVLNSINHNALANLVEILVNDFNKIGFKVVHANPFITTESNDISFLADVYDNYDLGATTVRWNFDTSNPVTSSTNPNDYYLIRTQTIKNFDTTILSFPVVHFEVTYFAANGEVTVDKSIVKKIEVEIIIETAEPYSINKNNVQYPRLIWNRTFIPNNINLLY